MNEDFNEEKATEKAAESREGFAPSDHQDRTGTARSGRDENGKRPRFMSRRTDIGGYRDDNPYRGGEADGYRPRYSRGQGGDEARPRYGSPDRGRDGYYPRRRYGEGRPFQDRYGGYSRTDGYNNRENSGYGRENSGYGRGGSGYEGNRYGRRPAYREGGFAGEGGRGGYAPRFNRQADGGYARPQGRRPRFGQGGYGNAYGRPRRDGYDADSRYSQKKRLEYKEENFDPTQPLRLNKFLSNAGVCSRRDADKYIQAGVVKVNGETVTELGTKVLRTDSVLFHDTPVKIEKKVYVLLNKPKGYVTTSEDPQDRKTVMDLVKGACPERIYPVGRLDRNTTGVLLMTNDGELASKLTHPKFLKKKIYHIYTDHNVTAADMKRIAEGVTLEDGEVKADAIEYASDTDRKQIGLEIHSGKNRVVRRIFASLGYQVVKLDRVYFAGLTKKNVRRGDWRFLTEKEVNMLRMGAYE